ncbi:hypothetical protein BROUX41_002007 [Berkeleyomyces rouxiae]|uniref:uncharacterized protein n=1 Tax=Berkeleyomyces rouxiae TaxID=2035830 RepID=UPI003B792A5A
MMQRPFTVASYAAGAGLAAVALVYVFAPTFFIDESDYRKKGAIGLINVGNDCFINSNLQSLAGLGELRIFLIRETYRRTIDGDSAYDTLLVQPGSSEPASSSSFSPTAAQVIPEWKLRGLQKGLVSGALKTILDRLNERPITRKTLSQRDFIRVLEMSFGQSINRQQQDAQEFLQLVFERLKEEYSAGQRVHREQLKGATAAAESENADPATRGPIQAELNQEMSTPKPPLERPNTTSSEEPEARLDQEPLDPFANEPGFPMDGERESHLTCQTCNYSTTVRFEPFTMLTLSVPQASSTTLATCFEKAFAPEYISDFKCEKCRLLDAIERLEKYISNPKVSPESKASAQSDVKKLQESVITDPEHPPPDVALPDISTAPLRTITRKTRISKYPRVLVVHLSRSIYDRVSQKNTAKVSFSESLVLGGLGNPKNYHLNSVITHRGGHTSGHYESFRRQCVSAPFSNPNRSPVESAFNKTSPSPSNTSVSPISLQNETVTTSLDPSLGLASSKASSVSITPSNSSSLPTPLPASVIEEQSPLSNDQNSSLSLPTKNRQAGTSSLCTSDSSSIRSLAKSVISRKSSRLSAKLRASASKDMLSDSRSNLKGHPNAYLNTTQDNAIPVKRRKRRSNDKWWRISDEKCRQAKTSDVLGMQREVYMLFYELDQKHLDHV